MDAGQLAKVTKVLEKNSVNSMEVITEVDALLTLPGMSAINVGTKAMLKKKLGELKVVTDFLCASFRSAL
jgi:hypothetical protein